jgi:glycosyltransferase involved in cell wall biosynthesis
MKSICFVASTPFAANAFLKTHLLYLSNFYNVTLLVNENLYKLDEEIKKKIHVHHLSIERNISFIKDLQALMQIAITFRSLKPDCVHSITPKAGFVAMLAAYITNVPHRFHTFTGQVWANKKGSSKFFLKFFDKLIVLFSTQIFTDSKSQSFFLLSQGVIKFGQAKVLGNGSIAGVNIHRFKPDLMHRHKLRFDLGVRPDQIIFLYVGRVTKDKGLFDLISAMNIVSRYSDAQLWIVGPDEAGIKRALSEQVETGTKIHWFGETFYPEQYMVAADVLVLPSYREGFGTVIIEAASCGLPAIAYRTEGVIDAIDDESTGILVEKFNINLLSQAMIKLSKNFELRKNMGLIAQKRAHMMFSSELVADAWGRFYRSQIGY